MKVLIIDDDADLRQAIAIKIASSICSKVHVIEAENGEDGLIALDTHSFTFVISDIQMPIMNGIEFLKRARVKFKDLPIFIMTGASLYTKTEILAMGATGYYEKPYIDVDGLLKHYSTLSA